MTAEHNPEQELAPLIDQMLRQIDATVAPAHPLAGILARASLGICNALPVAEQWPAQQKLLLKAQQLIQPWTETLTLDAATIDARLAEIAVLEQQTGQAKQLVQQAWQRLQNIDAAGHWLTCANQARIARALLSQSMFSEAEQLLRPAYRTTFEQLGPNNPDTVAIQALLEQLYIQWEKPALAAEFASPGAPK